MSTLVLLITRDRDLTKRLAKSLSDFTEDALTIECVERLSEATQRLNLNDSVEAVIMDWDLPAMRGFETLLVLMGAAPHLPIIILGDDPNLLQQMNLVEHGAQDYLPKRRLDADTLICMVHSAIARAHRPDWPMGAASSVCSGANVARGRTQVRNDGGQYIGRRISQRSIFRWSLQHFEKYRAGAPLLGARVDRDGGHAQLRSDQRRSTVPERHGDTDCGR
jgi:DNA-binding response OmpR family regulator